MKWRSVGPARSYALVLLLIGACERGSSPKAASNGRQAASRDDSSASAAFTPLAVGDVVPAYVTRSLTGDTLRIGTGQPVTLLNVWATWCTSCREEMGFMSVLHRDFAARGLRIVAVSVDKGNDTRIGRYVARDHLPFAVAHDPAGRIQQEYEVPGVPSTYLIGRDGRLLWSYTGNLIDTEANVRAAVQGALTAGAETK